MSESFSASEVWGEGIRQPTQVAVDLLLDKVDVENINPDDLLKLIDYGFVDSSESAMQALHDSVPSIPNWPFLRDEEWASVGSRVIYRLPITSSPERLATVSEINHQANMVTLIPDINTDIKVFMRLNSPGLLKVEEQEYLDSCSLKQALDFAYACIAQAVADESREEVAVVANRMRRRSNAWPRLKAFHGKLIYFQNIKDSLENA